jgi:hypothetical protein
MRIIMKFFKKTKGIYIVADQQFPFCRQTRMSLGIIGDVVLLLHFLGHIKLDYVPKGSNGAVAHPHSHHRT